MSGNKIALSLLICLLIGIEEGAHALVTLVDLSITFDCVVHTVNFKIRILWSRRSSLTTI